MKSNRSTFVFLGLFGLLGIGFGFQNCAPAKLSGDSSESEDSTGGISTVGTKVDLASLMASGAEPPENLVYPVVATVPVANYSIGNPMIENIVVKTNDFSRIEWILESNSTVVSNGDIFAPQNFSGDMSGHLYIFGYRADKPSYIGKIRLVSRASAAVAANSPGAVQLNQRRVFLDATEEIYSLDVQTPNVDINRIQWIISPSGATMENRRSVLIKRKLNETIEVEVKVTDKEGNVATQKVGYQPPAPVTTTTTTMPPSAPALFRIRTRVNNESFVDTASSNAGSGAHLWTIASNGNQDFQLSAAGELKAHGRCLVPQGSSLGSRLILVDCTGDVSQTWTYAPATALFKSANGLCMDLDRALTANGTVILMWTCTPANINQQWDLIPR